MNAPDRPSPDTFKIDGRLMPGPTDEITRRLIYALLAKLGTYHHVSREEFESADPDDLAVSVSFIDGSYTLWRDDKAYAVIGRRQKASKSRNVRTSRESP